MLIVYHGSDRHFKNLRISKDLVRSPFSELNEGIGIYFSTNKYVASSYGRYVYTLQINDKYLIDFRNKSNIYIYLNRIENTIYRAEKIHISQYVDLNEVLDYVYYGDVAVCGICREIALGLDSNEDWHRNDVTKIDRILSILRQHDEKNQVGYLFNYNIDGVGILRKVGTDIVRIVNCERI